MPQPVKDRCTTSHEYIFLLSKNKKYYYDYEAIKEPIKQESLIRNNYAWKSKQRTRDHREKRGVDNREVGKMLNPKGRNKRSVWTVNTKPSGEKHFATFPAKLIEPCILAGSSKYDDIKKHSIVLDPFSGIGTTTQLAKKLNRKYIGIELNPKYAKRQEQLLDEVVRNLFG